MKSGMTLSAYAGPEAARGWTHYALSDEHERIVIGGAWEPDSLVDDIMRKYGVTETDRQHARNEAIRCGDLPLNAQS